MFCHVHISVIILTFCSRFFTHTRKTRKAFFLMTFSFFFSWALLAKKKWRRLTANVMVLILWTHTSVIAVMLDLLCFFFFLVLNTILILGVGSRWTL
jgi:hypothetical protein